MRKAPQETPKEIGDWLTDLALDRHRDSIQKSAAEAAEKRRAEKAKVRREKMGLLIGIIGLLIAILLPLILRWLD